MTDEQRAALVAEAERAYSDAKATIRLYPDARVSVSPIAAALAAIEPAIRADERARVVAEATTDEAVERASKRLWAAKRQDAIGWAAAIRAALGAET